MKFSIPLGEFSFHGEAAFKVCGACARADNARLTWLAKYKHELRRVFSRCNVTSGTNFSWNFTRRIKRKRARLFQMKFPELFKTVYSPHKDHVLFLPLDFTLILIISRLWRLLRILFRRAVLKFGTFLKQKFKNLYSASRNIIYTYLFIYYPYLVIYLKILFP